MNIKSISVVKTASYEREKYGEYKGSVTVEGGQEWEPEIKIGLTLEQMVPIVSIIAQAVAENMQGAATAFAQGVADALNPPVEHTAIGDNSDG